MFLVFSFKKVNRKNVFLKKKDKKRFFIEAKKNVIQMYLLQKTFLEKREKKRFYKILNKK